MTTCAAGLIALSGLVGCGDASSPQSDRPAGQPGEPGLESSPAALASLAETYARSTSALRALIEDGQPEGENAIAIILDVGPKIRAVEASGVMFDALHESEATEEGRQALRRGVAELEAQGVGEALVRISRTRRAVPNELTGSGPMIARVMPELGFSRSLTRFNSARAVMAIEAGDAGGFVDRIDETLALSSHVSRQGAMIAGLVGVAVQARALEDVRTAIARGGLDDASLVRLANVIERRGLMDAAYSLRAERLLAEDTTEFVYFTGPAGLAWMQTQSEPAPTPVLRVIREGRALGQGMPSRVEQHALNNRVYAKLIEAASKPAYERGAELDSGLTQGNLLLGLLTPSIGRSLQAFDQFAADRAGTLALIAIERYRLATGELPKQLSDLTPTYLASVPADPYTGKALGYLGPRPGGYEGGRGFVLYAAGLDLTDDGGAVDFAQPLVKPDDAKGKDFLLNRSSR
ncbi:MAG: hypothetical protein SFZ23_06475 [Planctomycetota bacterium]|nr:hypothetical protein [Planctomycetota bacterium]